MVLFSFVWVGLVLFVAYVSVASMIKRLHDRDKSGHWLWLYVFLPLFGSLGFDLLMRLLQVAPAVASPISGALALVSTCLFVWGLVELGFLPGTKGPNRFGPDPRETPLHETGGREA